MFSLWICGALVISAIVGYFWKKFTNAEEKTEEKKSTVKKVGAYLVDPTTKNVLTTFEPPQNMTDPIYPGATDTFNLEIVGPLKDVLVEGVKKDSVGERIPVIVHSQSTDSMVLEGLTSLRKLQFVS